MVRKGNQIDPQRLVNTRAMHAHQPHKRRWKRQQVEFGLGNNAKRTFRTRNEFTKIKERFAPKRCCVEERVERVARVAAGYGFSGEMRLDFCLVVSIRK